MTTTEKIRTKIIFLINEDNISLRQFAKKSNLPPSTIQSILSNMVSSPRIETIEKIARAHNMSLEQFFKEINEE